MSLNSFGSSSSLKVGDKEYEVYRIDALDKQGISTKHLPFSLRLDRFCMWCPLHEHV